MIAPGLYQSLRLRRSIAITHESPALVVSVPVAADQSLAPLSDAEKEAQTVAENFQFIRQLSGSPATVAAIRDDLRGTEVFHFVGHAAALPELDGLLLANLNKNTQHAQMIDANTFTQGSLLHLQLAVLSACDTGAPSGNSGTEGIVEALLREGVPYVVASRWNVDSAETTKLMHEFYRHLIAGDSVAA